MTPLGESICIVLGASQWPDYEEFEGHDAFLNGATFVRDYMRGAGVTDNRILWLFDDDRQPAKLIAELTEFLKKFAGSEVKNVVLYYTGHGGYRQREYYLALRCTDQVAPELTTLPVRFVAKALAEWAPDKRQIVIVDACYAAAAGNVIIYQDGIVDASADVSGQLRAYAIENVPDRGTTVFCAAGARAKAKLPREASDTMFTGALRKVLTGGAPDLGELMTLAQVASLVEGHIRLTFGPEGVRPEVHTPRQEKGDLRDVPFFPNPAFRRDAETDDLLRLRAELELALNELAGVRTEAAWQRKSAAVGWYRLLELRMDLNQFGDVAQVHKIADINGPAEGEIAALPYSFAAPAKFGTCVLKRVKNAQLGWSHEDGLPTPAVKVSGQLQLGTPCPAGVVHRGFTLDSTLINSFAMTQADARLRGQQGLEHAVLRPSFPARHLRIVLHFPTGYAPTEPPRAVVSSSSFLSAADDWPEEVAETSRIASGFMYDSSKGLAVLNVERAEAGLAYAIRWKLPVQPSSGAAEEAARAKEQIRALTSLGPVETARVAKALDSIRKRVCKKYLGWRRGPLSVELSLLAFDEALMASRVIATTLTHAVPGTLPWGAGVVGWVMRRRRPSIVDTRARGSAGIYQRIEGHPEDRYILCVPISLPSDSERRSELLRDPSVPCAVAALSCVDESGNMERLMSDESQVDRPSSLVGAVSSEIVNELLDMISREVG